MRPFSSDQSARKQVGEGLKREKKNFIESWSLVMITVHFAQGVENRALPPSPRVYLSVPANMHNSLLFVIPCDVKSRYHRNKKRPSNCLIPSLTYLCSSRKTKKKKM